MLPIGNDISALYREFFPPAGPCAFCGWPDKHHRVYDAIKRRYLGGDPVASIAGDYGIPAPLVMDICHRELPCNS